MAYTTLATSQAPSLVIYLLDMSASMNQPFRGKRRVDVVAEGLDMALRQMVFRSTRGRRVLPRYRVAIFAYSVEVVDLLGGIKSIDEVAHLGLPELSPVRFTHTARAFAAAERLLEAELPTLAACPAPLVCHMTDGEHTGGDPEPAARRIMDMAVPDGHVLVENIFVSESILPEPIADLSTWPGVLPDTPLSNPYARKLRNMSSPLPETYRTHLREAAFHLAPGAIMLLPGMNHELVTMGFQMSTASVLR